jgi:hypothetical protein
MTTTLAAIGDFNGLAVAVFAVVLATTLVITWWAAKRNRSATDFYTAGRGVAGAFNGIATAGDYLSASTFLGYAGLMYLFGFDGWIIGLGAMLSFLPVLYLLADRMRNAGKFTVADVLSYRLRRRPVRIAGRSTRCSSAASTSPPSWSVRARSSRPWPGSVSHRPSSSAGSSWSSTSSSAACWPRRGCRSSRPGC